MSKAIEEAKIEEVVDTPEIPVEELAEKQKPYTLRDLTDEDIYPVAEIIGKVLPDDMKEAFVQVMNGEKSLKETGIMVVFDLGKLVLRNFSSVKAQMYAFLSSLSGIPEEELRKMPFGTTPKMIKEVFQDAKKTDFFKELSELLS